MSVRSARNEPFASILQRRWSRREFLATAGVSVAGLAVAAPAQMPAPVAGLEVTDELRWQRLLSLGDALWPRVPALLPADLRTMSWLNRDAVRRQARQFGDCCDAIAYFPQRPDDPDRGLLCVNHEYVDLQLVFAGFMPSADWFRRHPLSVPWMQAAHGVSVVAIERRDGQWHLQQGHALTRRITATTPCEIRGPARGHELLRSRADPRGVRAVGTFSNCSGGKTPWGTFLTAEENIQDNFGFAESWQRAGAPVDTAAAHERWPLKQESLYGWEHVDPRFDLRQDAREPLRHGWIVEIDPQDPRRPPIKRTALGRFCHESANTVLTADGRVAVYMGDDTKFEYVYKFVTRQRFDAASREANAHLLDDGQLFVARFDANGRGVWMPLVHDEKGPLNSRAGFRSQGDVVLKCRAAADLLGATPMDRPEDFQPNPSWALRRWIVRRIFSQTLSTAVYISPAPRTRIARRQAACAGQPMQQIRGRRTITGTSSR